MPFLWHKLFDLPNVIRIRSSTKNNRTQGNSIHGEPGHGSFIPGITNHSACPSPTPVSTSPLLHDVVASREPTGREVPTVSSDPESFRRRTSDMVQLFLPIVQVAAGAIPLAGPPMQAAIGGLLATLQAIDRNSQNTDSVASLRSRLQRLHCHLCNAPTAQDPPEQSRRDSLTKILQETSRKLANLSKHNVGYTSRVTQAITGCSSEINDYLLEYSVSSQMQMQNDLREVLVEVQRLKCSVGQGATQLTKPIALGIVTLVDATGYKHHLLVDHCASFQQLNMMVAVLLECDSIEAQIQKRYMEKGQYDLCIDEGTHVTKLTSHGWSRIEEGMTIVMRIIFEQPKPATPQYQCHICKTWNELISGSVDLRLTHCSIDCRGCNRRFEVSLMELYRKVKEGAMTGKTSEPSKIDANQTIEVEMWRIRNFHVQQFPRHRHSPTQLAALNELYEEHEYPSLDDRYELAEKLGMETKTVDAWFQNKRASTEKRNKPATTATDAQPQKSTSSSTLPSIANLLNSSSPQPSASSRQPASRSSRKKQKDHAHTQDHHINDSSLPESHYGHDSSSFAPEFLPQDRFVPESHSTRDSDWQLDVYAEKGHFPPDADSRFVSENDSASDGITSRKGRGEPVRNRTTPEQAEELRRAYAINAHPTKEEREEHAERVGMSVMI